MKYPSISPEHAFDASFWEALDRLVDSAEAVIDRPKGSAHPRYPDFLYPVDYGYLKDTASMDGGGIGLWLGSVPKRQVNAVMCVVDLVKRDSEIKLLIGCTEEETALVYRVHNQTPFQKGLLIRR